MPSFYLSSSDAATSDEEYDTDDSGSSPNGTSRSLGKVFDNVENSNLTRTNESNNHSSASGGAENIIDLCTPVPTKKIVTFSASSDANADKPRRDRPPKRSVDSAYSSSAVVNQSEVNPNASKPKRPVGRPCKIPIAPGDGTVAGKPKRPVGRPPKIPTAQASDGVEATKPKRPVGRPRKNPVAQDDNTVADKPKRPVGRPRKNAGEGINTTKPKRPVGQPRKNSIAQTNDDIDSDEPCGGTPRKRTVTAAYSDSSAQSSEGTDNTANDGTPSRPVRATRKSVNYKDARDRKSSSSQKSQLEVNKSGGTDLGYAKAHGQADANDPHTLATPLAGNNSNKK